MAHLKRINLGRVPSRYSSLRTCIIEAKLHELVDSGQSRATAPVSWDNQQTADAESAAFAQGDLDNNSIDFTMSDYGDPSATPPNLYGA
jgi:hypothetical protein